MDIRYTFSDIPKTASRTVFLSGPSPRDPDVKSWRPEALVLLEKLGFDGTVYVPEYEDGPKGKDYTDDEQIKWERLTMQSADIILFWVPRELKDMPAFTTNVEFGLYCSSGRVVYGRPDDAPKMNYLDWTAKEKKIKIHSSLEDACKEVITRTPNTPRKDGEVFVPSIFWNHSAFKEWYSIQKNAGHELKYARPLWSFLVGNGFLFSFALHVEVFIPEENRIKVNEFIIGRTPVVQAVLYEQRQSFLDTKVVLVKEFRSPGNTSEDGFVYELPGGSSTTKKSPEKVIVDEVREETGLEIDPDSIVQLNNRQGMGTFSIHKQGLFCAPLSGKDIQHLIDTKDQVRGVEADSERTTVVVKTVREIFNSSLVDFATLGMITEALLYKTNQ